MGKNIVIFLDGTWNDKDDPDALSNVALLHEMCVNDGIKGTVHIRAEIRSKDFYDKVFW